jgi:hypothetical protein
LKSGRAYEAEAHPPSRKPPQMTVMSVITVTPARKPLTYRVFLATLTMTMA